MVYYILGVCSGIAVCIFAFSIYRGNSNRRGVQSGDDALGELGKGIDTAEDTNTELGDGIDKAQGITGIIDSHNLSATNGIRTAKDILEDAKNRQPDT